MADQEVGSFCSETTFDIIGGLHNRYMQDVLGAIFEQLDQQSLQNAELVSNKWKMAIDDGNPSKLWDKFLHEKISTSPLWERLYYNFNQHTANSSGLNSRKFYSKIQYTIQSLKKNWCEVDFTRDFTDCDVGLRICVFQTRNKYICLWEPITGVFKIWNRQTLKLVEVYHVAANGSELDYELYEDALIYSLYGKIFIRNLTTKKTNVYQPSQLSGRNKIINYLRAENGYLCAAVGSVYQTDDRHDIVIWKMNTPTDFEWENVKIIPSLSIDNSRIYMDYRYIIIAHFFSYKVVCEVRQMSNPQKRKGRTITLKNTRPDLLVYHEGFLVVVTTKNEIKMVDVESGDVRAVIQTKVDFSQPNNFMRMHSGYIFVCSSVGCSIAPSEIQIWDFEASLNSTGGSLIEPFSSFTAYIDPAIILHFDIYGIVTITREMDRVPCRDTIRTLNFLPACNFCKDIKKKLFRCNGCKAAKYCNAICQRSDWSHHKEFCKTIQRVSFCHKVESAIGNRCEGSRGKY